jgi:predicted DNA-binding transcriptional regulator AlpA
MTRSRRYVALPPTLAPRLINREAAAAYVNVSPNTFDEMVKTGKMPKPKQIAGRRQGWDVRALDMAVDNLPTVGGDNAPDETWSDVDAA